MVWSLFCFFLSAPEYISELVESLEETRAKNQQLENEKRNLEEELKEIKSLVDPTSDSGEAFCNRERYWADYEERESADQ